MAKKSSIEKNNRRKKLAKKYAGRRSRLKAIAMDKTKPMEERFAATLKMAELPRNSAANRSSIGLVLSMMIALRRSRPGRAYFAILRRRLFFSIELFFAI